MPRLGARQRSSINAKALLLAKRLSPIYHWLCVRELEKVKSQLQLSMLDRARANQTMVLDMANLTGGVPPRVSAEG